MKTAVCDILVIGAGSPGLALALLLAEIGLRVMMVEGGALPGVKSKHPDSRTSALMQDSINVISTTGAWDLCAGQGNAMATMAIRDEAARPPIELAFHAEEIGQEIFGVNMPNADLRDALGAKATKHAHVTLRQGKLKDFTADDFGVSATLENGHEIRARLIVGADGRASSVRTLAGIDVQEHDYGQQAITCLIAHSKPHHDTSTEFHYPWGPFTLVPLPGNQSSVVWVDFTAQADEFMRMDKGAFTQCLQERSHGLLGEIDLVTPPQSWPLKRLKAQALIAKRTALIAEAAHVLHPLGAQGLNLSLRDVAALAETIADAVRLGQDIGNAATLKAYAARRQQDIAGRVLGTDLFNRLVSTSSPLSQGLRRLGLKTIDNCSFLKEIAMRQGMAPTLQDSRLARGQAL